MRVTNPLTAARDQWPGEVPALVDEGGHGEISTLIAFGGEMQTTSDNLRQRVRLSNGVGGVTGGAGDLRW